MEENTLTGVSCTARPRPPTASREISFVNLNLPPRLLRIAGMFDTFSF